MAQVIAMELKNKINTARQEHKLNKSTLAQEEYSLLLEIRNCEDADRQDRILAAKTLFEISDNQWRAIKNIADRDKLKWLELEHTEAVDRNINNVTNDILKSVEGMSVEDLMKVLGRMIPRK